MKKEYYMSPKPSRLMKLFWKAAGGDYYILSRSTYSDQIKYMCLGGIIISTSVMSFFSSSYAFYTIFEERGSALESEFNLRVAIMSIIFGAIWALIIYNIDRFIVTSTGKGDGTEKITWDEFKSAIPRIIMGSIIALTISKPLEIRMFKSEIDAKLHEEQLKLQKDYELRTKANFEYRILMVENKLKEINDKRKNLEYEREKLSLEATDQLQGRANAPAGAGPRYKELKLLLDQKNQELQRFNETYSLEEKQYKIERDKLLKEMNEELNKNKQVANGLDGLLERIKLSHQIAGTWITLFITLLFLTIELTPIFFKLMLVRSPYDYIEDTIKELVKLEHGIYIQYNYYKDKEGMEKDLVINIEYEKIIHEKKLLLEKQKELTELAIEEYIKKLKDQIRENPEKFIKTTIDKNGNEKTI